MKRLVSTLTVAAVLVLGSSQTFAGITGGRSEKPVKSRSGVIIGGKSGVIIGGKSGVIIGG